MTPSSCGRRESGFPRLLNRAIQGLAVTLGRTFLPGQHWDTEDASDQ